VERRWAERNGGEQKVSGFRLSFQEMLVGGFARKLDPARERGRSEIDHRVP
jgi:hypothetical protein